MEDPILAVTDGQNLQNITLRLSKEEAETCLSRLMSYTGPARATWPLITALGQVVFADRIGPLPRSLGVIKFDVDTESLGRKLEELNSGISDQPAEGDEPDEEEMSFEEWLSRRPLNTCEPKPQSEPTEKESSSEVSDCAAWLVKDLLTAIEFFGTQKAVERRFGKEHGISQSRLSYWSRKDPGIIVDHQGICKWLEATHEEWMPVHGGAPATAPQASEPQGKEKKATVEEKPAIDLSQAGQDDEPGEPPKVRQVLSPGRAAEICRSRKAIGTLENRLLEAFIQSGQKVDTFVGGLESVHGMVVVP